MRLIVTLYAHCLSVKHTNANFHSVLYKYVPYTNHWLMFKADLSQWVHMFVSATNIGNSRRLLSVREVPV